MTRPGQKLRALLRDRKGAYLVEFAILFPIFLMICMGLAEVGYRTYLSAVLQGAVNEAGRKSTLESAAGSLDDIDQEVKDEVNIVSVEATFTSTRKSYASFSDVGKPEPFNDEDGDETRDDDECYEDLNGNGAFDQDRGRDGIGGPDDIVSYTMTVRYPQMFPMAGILGWDSYNEISGTTVLRNQPYGNQSTSEVECKL